MKRNFIFGLLSFGIILGAGIFFSQMFQNIPCVDAAGDSKPPCAKTLGQNFLGYITGEALHSNSDGSGIGYINFTQSPDTTDPMYGVCVAKDGALSGEAWTNGHGKIVFDAETNVRKEGCGGNPEVSSNTNFSGCGYFYINTNLSAWTNLGGLKTATNIFESGLSSAVSILGSFTGKIGGKDFSIESKTLQFIPDGVTPITISITPTSATAKLSSPAKFTATVTGASDSQVIWEIEYKDASGLEHIFKDGVTLDESLGFSPSGLGNVLTVYYTKLPSKLTPYNTSGSKKQYLKIIAKAKADESKTAEAAFWLDETDASAPTIVPPNLELPLWSIGRFLVYNSSDFEIVDAGQGVVLTTPDSRHVSFSYSPYDATVRSEGSDCSSVGRNIAVRATASSTGKTASGNVVIKSPYSIDCSSVNNLDKTKKTVTILCKKNTTENATAKITYTTSEGTKNLACSESGASVEVPIDTTFSAEVIKASSGASCPISLSCDESDAKPSDFRVARVSANSTHLTWKDTTAAGASIGKNTLVRLRLTPTSTESKNIKVSNIASTSARMSWENATTWGPFDTHVEFSPTSTFATGTILKIATGTIRNGSTTVTGLNELTYYYSRVRACSPINPKSFPVGASKTKNVYTKWGNSSSGESSLICQLNPAYATTTPTSTLPIEPTDFKFPEGNSSIGTTDVTFSFVDNSKLRSGYQFYVNNVSVGSMTFRSSGFDTTGNIAVNKDPKDSSKYIVKISSLKEGTKYIISVKAFGTAKGDPLVNNTIYSKPLLSEEFMTDYTVTITTIGANASLDVFGCNKSDTVSGNNSKSYICENGDEMTVSTTKTATNFSESSGSYNDKSTGSKKVFTTFGTASIVGKLCDPFTVRLISMPNTNRGQINTNNGEFEVFGGGSMTVGSDESCLVTLNTITGTYNPSDSVFWTGCESETGSSCTIRGSKETYVGFFNSNGILLSNPDANQQGIGGPFYFQWSDPQTLGAEYYKVCVSTGGPGCGIYATTTSNQLYSTLLSSQLERGIRYYWYVQGLDSRNNVLGSSQVRIFGYDTMDVGSEPTPEEAIAKARALKIDEVVKEEKQVEAPEFATNVFDAMNGFVSKKVNAFLGAREVLMGNILGIDHMGSKLQASLISKNPVKELYDVFSTVLNETNSIMGSLIAQAAGGIEFGGYEFGGAKAVIYPNKPKSTDINVSYEISQDYASVYDTNLEPGIVYGYILTESGNTYYGAAETLPKEGIYGTGITVTTGSPTDSGINQCQKHNVCSKATKFSVTKTGKNASGTIETKSFETNNECTMNSDCEYVGRFQERGGQEQ